MSLGPKNGETELRWVVCLIESQTKQVVPWDGACVEEDDPRYEDDVHILPIIEGGETLFSGVHEVNRNCACHPRVQPQVHGRTMIFHSEKVS